MGQLKKLRVESLRLCQRGDLGQIGLRFLQRTDQLVDLRGTEGTVLAVRLSGREGRHLRWSLANLASEDGTTPGIQLPLRAGESVVELVPLITMP
jgi:DNA gyrase subunit A